MGKRSRRNHSSGLLAWHPDAKFTASLDWSNYDVLRIRGSAVFACNKVTRRYCIIVPVAPWEIDSLIVRAVR